MGDIEKTLREQLEMQELAVDRLISQAIDTQQQTLSNLLETRKTIADLTQLLTQYPKSKEIPRRLKICDELLVRGNNTINDINVKLPEYRTQKEELSAKRKELEQQLADTHNSPPRFG